MKTYICRAKIVEGVRIHKGMMTADTGGTPTIDHRDIRIALKRGERLMGKRVRVYYEVIK